MTCLWKIGDFPPPGTPDFVSSAYDGLTPYLLKLLTAPHPYRSGVMCPFMPGALAKRNIYFTYFDSKNTDKELQQLISFCIDFYKANRQGAFGAMIILFEGEFEVLRLLQAHIKAKSSCIRNELMLGALYKESQAPSLHSDKYFPLRTPTPILVMRDLTAHDLQFMHPNHYSTFSKIIFLNSFIRKFSKRPSQGKIRIKVEEAILLRSQYLLKILIFSGLTITLSIAFINLYNL